MKRLVSIAVLTLLMFVFAAFSQSPAEPSVPFKVLKYEWKPNYANTPAPEKPIDSSIFPSLPERDALEAVNNVPPRTEPQRIGNGGLRRDVYGNVPTQPAPPQDAADLPTNLQVGDARTINANLDLRNLSTQAIVSFEADYIFFGRDDKEYLRYRMAEDKSVKPNDVLKVRRKVSIKDRPSFTGTTTPATIFDLSPIKVDVVVVSVKFADGTVWKAK